VIKRLAFAALTAFVGVLTITLVASTSRLNTTMTRPATPHAPTRCHPTQHGACWLPH
jgi:hypothetical protein